MTPATASYDTDGVLHSAHGIAIRNIWLLMLYASELFNDVPYLQNQSGKEREAHELPDVIAEILVYFVKERLLRGLTRSSLPQQADLSRVRGRIDMLRTEGHHLLDRGRIACRFHEPTLNTPRNRLIKAALEKGGYLASSRIATTCREYAALMFRMGVTGNLPDRSILSTEVDTINTREDRQALAAAHLLLEMAIPTSRTGKEYLLIPEVNERWLRSLFERAVRGFYRVTASQMWDVEKGNVYQDWPLENCSDGVFDTIPRMELDIVLTHKEQRHKVIIDTKFTSLLKLGHYGKERLSSAYLYQMYAYLRAQEESGDKHATGILLHPATETAPKFSCSIQGHTIIFATVNLNATAADIRQSLLALIDVI